MADVADGYDTYYAWRLWQLLPALYRTEDTERFDADGPLRELVARIGAQAAVVRRSIDRLWADQSIETCDDWVIPYIGDLLATNLVAGLEARGQRLDVANTIHYRRRKGTVAVLEEIAGDVTGWDARVVECFRRLSRTRHGLDPPTGLPAEANDPVGAARLQRRQGLVGLLTGTPMGGFADLRAAHGADLTDTPFDELFHTADVRRPRGAVGRYGIPKLAVFVWRLVSFGVVQGTPVPVTGCPNQYCFDPMGREVPLFLKPVPRSDDFADTWVPSREWEVPGPLSASLYRALHAVSPAPPRWRPYPDVDALLNGESYAVTRDTGTSFDPLDDQLLRLWPDLGRFEIDVSVAGPELRVDYHYGFGGTVGSGPYDRRVHGDPPGPVGLDVVIAGASGLDAALGATSPTGTVTIADSLTYATVADVGDAAAPLVAAVVRAAPRMRPVVRTSAGAPPWIFTGTGDSELVLDGLTVSGTDVVLRGGFASVRLTACTFDPGTAGAPPDALATSLDGRSLAPTRLWIEADPSAGPNVGSVLRRLIIDHCVLGPVRARNGGAVEQLEISDSIVQGIRTSNASSFGYGDVLDPTMLGRSLLDENDPVSQFVRSALPSATLDALAEYTGPLPPTDQLVQLVVDGLDDIIAGPSVYEAARFSAVVLRADIPAASATATGDDLARLNRLLLEAAFPLALQPLALALPAGSVDLRRVTVLGQAAVHRLEASECILDDLVVVDDTQDGCVRFSAWSTGSVIPRQYVCVEMPAGSSIFTSRAFGHPGYGQLLDECDRVAVGGAIGATISHGAATGSEMGAFSAALAPIKERGVLIKFAEYMPLGLAPVVVHVT